MMENWTWQEPLWFWLCLTLPVLMWWRSRKAVVALQVPFAAQWQSQASLPLRAPMGLWAGYLGLVLAIAALARPQVVDRRIDLDAKGYDLMLAIDLSTSMLAEDFEEGSRRLNRLQAILPIVQKFISQRPNDRIGIILFAGVAYTLAPLTFDHEWLRSQVARIEIGLIEDGTAIGDALGLAVARLQQPELFDEQGQRQGAFIVLLTDGANNRGDLQPLEAAALAAARGIPVYTIGAGRDGVVPVPVLDRAGNRVGMRQAYSDLDEETLRAIAGMTGGTYLRAYDGNSAERAFTSISRAQPIEFERRIHVEAAEMFPWFLIPALGCWLWAAWSGVRTQVKGVVLR